MLLPSAKQLEMLLQQLDGFENPNMQLEQYQTPANIAAQWLWSMHMQGEVQRKIFADLAAGPGILGIGLLLLGAKEVHFVDIDPKVLKTAKQNEKDIRIWAEDQGKTIGNAIFHEIDVKLAPDAIKQVDCVIQNPPFGTKQKHADKLFLEAAFKMTTTIYSMHKVTTEQFIEAITKDHQFNISDKIEYKFPLKNTMKQHKKKVAYTEVAVWKLEKEKNDE